SAGVPARDCRGAHQPADFSPGCLLVRDQPAELQGTGHEWHSLAHVWRRADCARTRRADYGLVPERARGQWIRADRDFVALYFSAARLFTPACRDGRLPGPGELLIRGANVVKGYWNKPQATAETFVNGWLHTGDLARIDAEGFVQIV